MQEPSFSPRGSKWEKFRSRGADMDPKFGDPDDSCRFEAELGFTSVFGSVFASVLLLSEHRLLLPSRGYIFSYYAKVLPTIVLHVRLKRTGFVRGGLKV